MDNAYIYPISARGDKKINNPYLDNFMKSIQDRFNFINKNHPSHSGIFDIVKYIFKIDFAFFHWPENIAEKKMGFFQTLVFLYIFIPCMKIRKIKIVYIVHNKLSHTQNRIRLKKLIARKLLKSSAINITHAGEGVGFIHSMVKTPKKVFFFPHPVDKPLLKNTNPKKEIDILIWGNIAPYKGIDNFLKLLKEKNAENWNVVIAGKVSSEKYMHELNALKPDNVVIIYEFLDDFTIEQLISKSRIVLFPYHSQSVLSSGAFAKTLAFPVKIIGPHCGAFLDFNQLKQVNTFKNEEQLFDLISNGLSEKTHNQKNIMDNTHLMNDYSWKSFGKAFLENLSKKHSNKKEEITSI